MSWEREEAPGRWLGMESNTCTILETAFRNREPTVRLGYGIYRAMGGCTVDFATMTLISDDQQILQRIRKNTPSSSFQHSNAFNPYPNPVGPSHHSSSSSSSSPRHQQSFSSQGYHQQGPSSSHSGNHHHPQAYLNPPFPAGRSHLGDGGTIWEWQDGGIWTRFDENTSIILERSVPQGSVSLNFRRFKELGGCIISFQTMTVVPAQGPPIPLRRIPPLPSRAYQDDPPPYTPIPDPAFEQPNPQAAIHPNGTAAHAPAPSFSADRKYSPLAEEHGPPADALFSEPPPPSFAPTPSPQLIDYELEPDSTSLPRPMQPTPAFSQVSSPVHDLQKYAATLEGQITKGTLRITDRPKGRTLLSYAVLANNKKAVSQLVALGADLNEPDPKGGVPLFLALENPYFDGTDMLRHLLSLGASASKAGVSPKSGKTLLEACKSLTARHWAKMALETPQLGNTMDILVMAKCAWAAGLDFTLIGQQLAKQTLQTALIANGLKASSSPSSPMVLLFAGPSGHGRGSLARLLASLAGAPSFFVPCGLHKDLSSLFGPQHPFPGWEQGSPLNNFLCEHHGGPAVVVFEELERAQEAVWGALASLFEAGGHEDRRGRGVVDCSRMTFILTTSLANPGILDLWSQSPVFKGPPSLSPEAKEAVSKEGQKLCTLISQWSSHVLGPSLTGRISQIIPFVPFSEAERLVLADELVRESLRRFRQPASDSKPIAAVEIILGPPPSLSAPIPTPADHQEEIPRFLATFYNPELGACSLISALETQFERVIIAAWLERPQDRYYVSLVGGQVVASDWSLASPVTVSSEVEVPDI